MTLVYVDTSALLKLIADERETPALRAWCHEHRVRFMSADLIRTEVMRAMRRINPAHASEARRQLGSIGIINVDHSVYDEAGITPTIELRSLDAIHLTAARLFGDQLDGMLTYDERLAEAAQAVGIRVFGPE